LNWKEFLNWCNVHQYSVSAETSIPHGKKVEVIKSAKEKVIVNHYTSGKYLVQGKDTAFKLEIHNLLANDKKKHGSAPKGDYDLYMGSDESGKGDYFGPLVVAACYVGRQNRDKVLALGVRDSKKIRDQKILELAPKIKQLCEHEICLLSPKMYNQSYFIEKNLNHILVQLHTQVHLALHSRCTGVKGIIIDQFTPRKNILVNALKSLQLPVEQAPKAEEYLPVACASILAREAFLLAISDLEYKYDLFFPKGAGLQVDLAAKAFLKQFGAKKMTEVAKLHFTTSEKIGL